MKILTNRCICSGIKYVSGGALGLLMLLVSPLSLAASTLYGVTGDGATTPETLFTISKTDASTTNVLTLGAGDDGEAIGFNPTDGLLYHASGVISPIFESINPNTLIIDTSPFDFDVDRDEVLALTFNSSTGKFLYNAFTAVGELREVAADGTGVAILGNLEDLSSNSYYSKGLAFVGSDLYSVDRASDMLRKVDLVGSPGSTLSEMPITLAGETVVGANGLATDPDTGILWGVLKLSEQRGRERELVTIDHLTGVATSVGNLGDRFAGIAFVPGDSPNAFNLAGVLLVVGLLGSGLMFRRRQVTH